MLCSKSGTTAGDPHNNKCRSLKRRLRQLSSKMTGSGPVSPYERMDDDGTKTKKKKAKVEDSMDKENNNLKEVKANKKKRSWKRFRQAALTTCRYIGMGVAHMSPATVHSAPDYYIDPRHWDKSFSHSYRQQNTGPPHCYTSTMMFTAGW